MILISTYVFYGDIYFIWNILIKATTLLVITISFGKIVEVSIRKIIFLACLTTVIEISILCVVPSYIFFVAFVNLFEVPLMVFLLFSKKKRFIGKGIVRGYVFTIMINGILELMWNQFGEMGSYFMMVFMSCGSMLLGVMIYGYSSRKVKGVFVIELRNIDKKVETYGFYDSGNCLKDPYTGKGVHIVSKNIVEELITSEMNKVLIPYHSLGISTDLIEVVYIDEMIIYRKKDIVRQHKIPIGIAKEEMFLNKPYKIIINEEVF